MNSNAGGENLRLVILYALLASAPPCALHHRPCPLGFIGAMAWTAWPTAVIVVCIFAGILVSLQLIMYGFHHIAPSPVNSARYLVGSRLCWEPDAGGFVFVRDQAQGSDQAGEVQGPARPAQEVVRPVSACMSVHARHAV